MSTCGRVFTTVAPGGEKRALKCEDQTTKLELPVSLIMFTCVGGKWGTVFCECFVFPVFRRSELLLWNLNWSLPSPAIALSIGSRPGPVGRGRMKLCAVIQSSSTFTLSKFIPLNFLAVCLVWFF